MNRTSVVAMGVGLSAIGAIAIAAAPPAAKAPPPPIATYWMDVATQSGMGAGMTAGARPDPGQIMAMMSGRGSAVRVLDLRLASRDKPAAAPEANHMIPPGLQMGASLPLLTPQAQAIEHNPVQGMPRDFQRPKGRMLIYWGCGEHSGPGQPTIIDFSKIAAGQMPPGMAALSNFAHVVSGPSSAPGFGRWPNQRDSRAVPATGSLIGAHQIAANYAPPIAFSLGAGQDFMAALGLREAGALPSGASRLMWQPAATATGYALAMFGSNGGGDVVMWSSARSASMPAMDYVAPGEVRRLIASGAVLSPATSECLLPAEVAAASPMGMVTMIGYGPEADFTDNPKAPKWAAKVRFKTTASAIRGMNGMMGEQGRADPGQQQPQQAPPPRKKRGFGIGNLLGAIPLPQ